WSARTPVRKGDELRDRAAHKDRDLLEGARAAARWQRSPRARGESYLHAMSPTPTQPHSPVQLLSREALAASIRLFYSENYNEGCLRPADHFVRTQTA